MLGAFLRPQSSGYGGFRSADPTETRRCAPATPSERGYIPGYSRKPSAAPSTRTSLLTELAMKQASCAL
jgi:hypothetical protein